MTDRQHVNAEGHSRGLYSLAKCVQRHQEIPKSLVLSSSLGSRPGSRLMEDTSLTSRPLRKIKVQVRFMKQVETSVSLDFDHGSNRVVLLLIELVIPPTIIKVSKRQ